MVNQQYGARFRAQSGGPYDHGWHQTLAPGTLVPGGRAGNPHRGNENASLQGKEVTTLTSLGVRISPARQWATRC